MSTLFTSPMDCGPVNDLKRLGGRVEIDNSRLYDRTVAGGNASASGSRTQASQPFRAVPTANSGFAVRPAQPSHQSRQQAPRDSQYATAANAPAWSQAFHQQHAGPVMQSKGKARALDSMQAIWARGGDQSVTQTGPFSSETRSVPSGAAGWSREFVQVSPQSRAGQAAHAPSQQLNPAQFASHGYSAMSQYPQNFQQYGQQPYWMPSASQPQFHADGRLQQNAGSGLDTIQKDWNDVFDQIEREFTGSAELAAEQMGRTAETPFLDVPRNLDEALSQARSHGEQREQSDTMETNLDTSVQGANMGWEEEITDSMDQQEEQNPLEEEEDFDQAGFAAFYGRHWQPGGTAESQAHAQESAARAAELQRSVHGISSDEAESLLTRGHVELAHDQLDTARRLGYLVNQPKALRREEVGRYLFNKANPYIGLSAEQKVRLMTDQQQGIQYQNVLQHEASVLEDPRDARAWFSLGIRQQENERDDQAIHALLQSIRLEPALREAYLALAVSYANEGDLLESHNVLEKWISIFQNAGEEGPSKASAHVAKSERHETLANTLMEMARMAPQGDIDADVQIALGVLFNASEEYDKAQDCFRVALQARQDDWMLYNRLGATLANGGKPDEALQCYEEALHRNPGYVRATFNVGIACIKLARYQEAVDYVIKALRLQQAEALVSYKNSDSALKNGTSEGMWQTLRTAFSNLDRMDLIRMCDAKDLDGIEAELEQAI